MYTIYKITSPFGKAYIGCTRQKLEYRWDYGHGYTKNKDFYADIKKYGWKNFKKEVLATNIETLNEAREKESYYVALYDTFNNGYNKNRGGLDDLLQIDKSKKVYCIETKQVFNSKKSAAKFIKADYKNFKRVLKTRTKIKNLHFCYLEEKDTYVIKPAIIKKIYCFETDQFYSNACDAARKLNLPCSECILKCCHGTIRSYKKYHFRFA